MWHTSLLWKPFLLIPEDASGIEHFPHNLAVLHKCKFKLQSRKYCEAIMEDLLLFTLRKSSHFDKLEDLLKAMCKNGLNIFPKKCQLFKTDLQYMGNTIFIRSKRVCVRPLRNWIEAFQKLKPPTTINGCRSFAGMVNFFSIFCPELQKLLKPIYDFTRKGRQFVWGEEQQ